MKAYIQIPTLVIKFFIAIPVMMAIIFWPAGTLAWKEGWMYLVMQLGVSAFLAAYLFKNDPDLLEKRMELKAPKKEWDRLVMLPFVLAMCSLLIVPGLDAVRYGWSRMSVYLEILGFVGFCVSSYLLFLVMEANSFLLKTVEIQKDQQVISSGPYSMVRHPMYLSVIIMVFSIALALGSYYALIPAAIASIMLIIRTSFEDRALQQELKGYKAYAKKVRYRLIPELW